MYGNHLTRIGLASVTLTCFAVILLQGCQKPAEQPPPPPARNVESAKPQPRTESNVTPPQPTAEALPVPSGGLTNGIPSTQAQQHIGETNTVCGLIASTRYLESGRGGPTFLNFDRPYPNHTLTVLIGGTNRVKFASPPETMYDKKVVCVTGAIIEYHGKPEIVVQDPSQIVIEGEAPPTASGTATNANPETPPAASATTSDTSQKAPTTATSPP
jgi:hypothetical protein